MLHRNWRSTSQNDIACKCKSILDVILDENTKKNEEEKKRFFSLTSNDQS